MAYRIKCDGYDILDTRDEDLIVVDPNVRLEVNTVGEGSFKIYKTHPNYDKLQQMRSIFEVSDDVGVIFRGRMTGNTIDFHNGKAVDLEGVMAFFNDSVVRPFSFNFTDKANKEVPKKFLKQLIDQHNDQVEDFQKFKLGNVTVYSDSLERSNSEYASTWSTLESKLFGSSLGGYLCIRYEADGNYIDYLAEFTETNTQEIVFGENLMNISNDTNALEVYSAILPIGKSESSGAVPNISGLDDEESTKKIGDDDLVKSGDIIYSKSAVAQYGFVCAIVKWEDVTLPENLLTKAAEQLKTGIMLSETIEVQAVDLHFSDKDIESFRIYRNVIVRSKPHGLSKSYQLTSLMIPLLTPQNTEIVVGSTQKTLIGSSSDIKTGMSNLTERVDSLAQGLQKDPTYENAKAAGYNGTEAEFNAKLVKLLNGDVYVKPSGTIEIKGNDTYDVTNCATVIVNLPIGYTVTLTGEGAWYDDMSENSNLEYSIDGGNTWVAVVNAYGDIVSEIKNATQIQFRINDEMAMSYDIYKVVNGSSTALAINDSSFPYYSENVTLTGDTTFRYELS